MTTEIMTEFLKSCCLMSILLLLGTFLRAKISIFRKLFLPASVIGGFIGLILGPCVLGGNAILPISQEWLNAWTILPGILIIPIFASTPLGMFSTKDKAISPTPEQKKKSKKGLHLIAVLFGTGAVIKVVTSLQEVIGLGTNVVYSAINPDAGLYKTFGYELARGFAGGHGSAGMVGSLLQGYGFEYWETAQGVTSTTATFGLIAGMIIGIIAINIASRKGYTTLLKKPADIPLELSRGYETDISKQESLGRETTMSSSIEAITTHIALIMTGCGLGYLIQSVVNPSGSLPVWFFCLAAMYPVDWVLAKLNLGWMVDKKLKARIVGSMSDFAVVAAIASIPVEAVSAFMTPMFIMMFIGLVITVIAVFFLFFKLFPDRHPFEHAIMILGLETGVMINGIMLLKICDPNFETTALNDVSMGQSVFNIISLPLTLISYQMIKTSNNAMELFITFSAILALGIVLYIVFLKLYQYARKSGTQQTV